MKRFLMVLVLAVVIGVAYLFIHQNRTLSAKITIQVAPAKGTSITLNGRGRSAGTLKARPGSYKIVIGHPGFTTSTTSITVTKGDDKYVGVALVSNSPSTANWYKDNPSDEKIAETISSRNFSVLQAEQEKNLPLIKDLPLIDQVYRVDYGKSLKNPNDPAAVAIYVTYYSVAGKQQALAWLKFKGYTPANTEIIYTNATPSSD